MEAPRLRVALEQAAEREPVELGDENLGDHHGRSQGARLFERRLAVARELDRIPGEAQEVRFEFPDLLVALDDEDEDPRRPQARSGGLGSLACDVHPHPNRGLAWRVDGRP